MQQLIQLSCYAQENGPCEAFAGKGPWDENFPSWLNSGDNPIAMALFGSVSYVTAQAATVPGLANTSLDFVALGPTARHYERYVFLPNNWQVDSFLFNWAPAPSLQKELLELYRPVAHRFEAQANWIPRLEKAVDLAKGFYKKRRVTADAARPQTFEVSMFLSINFALELVRKQEVKRGFRYQAVLLCRPDVLIQVDLKLSEYQLDTSVFHTNGNGNTGDTLFLMASPAAERMACLPSLLASYPYYGSILAHSPQFLPAWMPDVTGRIFQDSDSPASKNFPFVGDSPVPFKQNKLIWPYRKQVHENIVCGSEYDRHQRQRCESWTAAHNYDYICRSLKRQAMRESPPPTFRNLTFMKDPMRTKSSATGVSPPPIGTLREACSKFGIPAHNPFATAADQLASNISDILFGPRKTTKKVSPEAQQKRSVRPREHPAALVPSLDINSTANAKWDTSNMTCECSMDNDNAGVMFAPWTNSGKNPVAMVLFGSVSLLAPQATQHDHKGHPSAPHEKNHHGHLETGFIALGPTARYVPGTYMS